jgi:spermidine/putrescine transport system permease protein
LGSVVLKMACLSRGERRIKLARFLVVVPPLLYLLLLYVVPVVIMLCYSFWALDENYRMVPAWNLEQYKHLLRQPAFATILFRSVRMAFLNTVINLSIAYPLAYYLSRSVKTRWKNLLLVMLVAPSWTSFLIRCYAWMLILGDNGLVNFTLREIGIIRESLPLLFNQTSLLITLLYIYLPYMLLPIYASLEKINPTLLEAAQGLGANQSRAFLRVTLPLSVPGVIAGCMITFIPTLGEYVAPAILGGRSGYMYGNLIADQFKVFDWPAGASFAGILLALVLLLMVVLFRFVRLQDIWGR